MFGYGDRMAMPARSLDPDARDRLAALAPRVVSPALARERVVPVHPSLAALFPDGIPCGSTVVCGGTTAMSSALLLVAEATRQGAWLGVLGSPTVGVAAAHELGVMVERMVLVRDRPVNGGRDDEERHGQMLAAVIDGFDVVLMMGAARVRAGTARRVAARLRTRGAMLVVVGDPGPFTGDLRLDARSTWRGLGQGHGVIRARAMDLTLEGRRVPRARRCTIWAPDAAGEITPVIPVTPVVSTALVVPTATGETGMHTLSRTG